VQITSGCKRNSLFPGRWFIQLGCWWQPLSNSSLWDENNLRDLFTKGVVDAPASLPHYFCLATSWVTYSPRTVLVTGYPLVPSPVCTCRWVHSWASLWSTLTPQGLVCCFLSSVMYLFSNLGTRVVTVKVWSHHPPLSVTGSGVSAAQKLKCLPRVQGMGEHGRDPQLRAAGVSSQPAQKGIKLINPRLYNQDFSIGWDSLPPPSLSYGEAFSSGGH